MDYRSRFLALAVLLVSPLSLLADPFRAPIEDADLKVAPELSYRAQVERHRDIVLKLQTAGEAVEAEVEAAEKSDSLGRYKQAVGEMARVAKFFEPYDAGQLQAKQLKNDGRVLRSTDTGEVCNAGGQCSQVDPITALFMIIVGALTDELNKENPFDPQKNDLVKFLIQPAGGPHSEFVKIRSILIPQDDNGEIAKILRDPIKRPVEVIQNIRDAVIPPKDNGEISKIIRDPIKCTVGRLFGGC